MSRETGSARQRIFLGPIEIAGVMSGLEVGLRANGRSARLYDISGDPFGYRRPRDPNTRRAWPALLTVVRLGQRGLRAAARLVVFARVLFRYDVFVIGGTGFWDGRELPILRALGKTVVWVFLGSDHRPPYLNGKAVLRWPVGRLDRETGAVAARVRRVEGLATAIIAHEASAQFHTRPFVRLVEIGLPIRVPDRGDAEGGVERGMSQQDAPISILHCPTDRAAKGTDVIRSLVDGLRRDGARVEYREISNRPRHEVLHGLAEADILIDEAYGDTPLGALAAEAAWFGVPSICGGYYADACPGLSDGTRFPSVFVRPELMPEALRALVGDQHERHAIGLEAQAFVQERWNPTAVARRLIQVIEGTAPREWSVAPADVRYLGGYGLPREGLPTAVRRLVSTQGRRALRLTHRPDLETELLAGLRSVDDA